MMLLCWPKALNSLSLSICMIYFSGRFGFDLFFVWFLFCVWFFFPRRFGSNLLLVLFPFCVWFFFSRVWFWLIVRLINVFLYLLFSVSSPNIICYATNWLSSISFVFLMWFLRPTFTSSKYKTVQSFSTTPTTFLVLSVTLLFAYYRNNNWYLPILIFLLIVFMLFEHYYLEVFSILLNFNVRIYL